MTQTATRTPVQVEAEKYEHGPEWWGSTYQTNIFAGASEHLIRKTKLYRTFMENWEKQSPQKLLWLGQLATEGTIDRASACAQEIAKLAELAEPGNTNGDELVVFEVWDGQGIHIAAIGGWLAYHTLWTGDRHIVAYTPRWVYATILEAAGQEHAILENWPGSEARFRIGEACSAPTEDIAIGAMTLWEPYTNGVYRKLSDAFHTAELLG